jgi:hypothetical protein
MKILIISLVLFSASISSGELINVIENKRVWPGLDENYEPKSVEIDLDQDGITDVEFYGNNDVYAQYGVFYLRLKTPSNVFVKVVDASPDPREPALGFTTFLEDSAVDNTESPPFGIWASGDLPHLGFDILGGPPGNDSYLLVKIIKETESYFGWIRLIFPDNYNQADLTGYVKVKEYAFEDTPSTPIVTGVGISPIKDPISNQISYSTEFSEIKIHLTGEADLIYTLEESLNLVDWDVVSNNSSVSGQIESFFNPSKEDTFYRWILSENLE